LPYGEVHPPLSPLEPKTRHSAPEASFRRCPPLSQRLFRQRSGNPIFAGPMKNSPNQDRVALVTGAANRLGAAMARALAAAGWSVVIHHRGGREEAVALADEIVAAGGQAATL